MIDRRVKEGVQISTSNFAPSVPAMANAYEVASLATGLPT